MSTFVPALALWSLLAVQQGTQPLAIFAPLIGRDWVAPFSDNNVTDTQRFEWVFGDKFVRNVHHVRAGKQVVYEGETLYAWDERAKRIVWWYWNTTGGFVTGTVTVKGDGEIVSEGENHGATNQLDRTRTVMRIGNNEWTSTGSQEKDGTWTDQPARTYKPAASR